MLCCQYCPKNTGMKNTHTYTHSYRWQHFLNCPSHGSPCVLTLCLFSQADVIVKLFLKRDTIEKADSCSMARVLPLIPNRAVYSSVCWRNREKLFCSALIPRPFTFYFSTSTQAWKHMCTHTNTGRYISVHVHIHPLSFKYCPCPNAFYYMIPTDQWKPRRHHTHRHTHIHTGLCVARRQMVSAVDACYSQQLWYGDH